MEIALTSKQYRITGIYGGGKPGTLEEEDKKGWTVERQHLYPESTQITAQNLKQQNLPSEIIGLIVDQTDTKPVIISKEKSVFPSPTQQKPGFQEGGWIVVGLEAEPNKGDAQGFIRFETRYMDHQGKMHTTKDVDLRDAEKAVAEGKKEWASSVGVEKVLVLKQYVDAMRKVLEDKSCFGFPQGFMDWFQIQVEKFGLTKELEKLNKLKDNLAAKKEH